MPDATPNDEQVRAAREWLLSNAMSPDYAPMRLIELAALLARREAALVKERDEALLQATFREDKHAAELGEKLLAALAERDELAMRVPSIEREQDAMDMWNRAAAERDALAQQVAALREALDDVRTGCFCSVEYGVDGNDHDSSCKKAVAVLTDDGIRAAAAAHDERVRADERERLAQVLDRRARERDVLANGGNELACYEAQWCRADAAAIRGRKP